MTDIWQMYQRQSEGLWHTKVMLNQYHIKTFVTPSAWGGRRLAKKLIRRRRND